MTVGIEKLKRLAVPKLESAALVVFSLSIFLVAVLINDNLNQSRTYWRDASGVWILLALVTAFCLLGAAARAEQIPKPISIFFKLLSLYWAVYIFAAEYSWPVSDLISNRTPHLEFVIENSLYIGLILSALSFYRFYFYPLLVASQEIFYFVSNAAVPYSAYLDRWPILDGPSILAIATVLILLLLKSKNIAAALAINWAPLEYLDRHYKSLIFLLFLYSVALHFGNYLFAGLEKIEIVPEGSGFHLLSWISINDTSNLLLVAREFRVGPLANLGEHFEQAYWIVAAMVPALNAFVLLVQLGSVVGLYSLRTIIGFSLAFDALHIGIFVITGLFFYKWIVLNMVIAYVAYLYLRREKRRIGLLAAITAATLVVMSVHLVRIPKLGWFDSNGANVVRVYGVTVDGTSVLLPPRYFGNSSFALAGTFVIRPPRTADNFDNAALGKLFNQIPWGNQQSYELNQARIEFCEAQRGRPAALSEDITREYVPPSSHKRFFDLVHGVNAARLNDKGHLKGIDLYPHHLQDNPAAFPEFWETDLREITKYRVEIEAVCAFPDKPRGGVVVSRWVGEHTIRPNK